MRRALIFFVVLATAACSSGSEDASVNYFQEAATITATYESAAQGHFDGYLTALQEATAETIDAAFVDANKSLFAGLATDFGPAMTALGELTPPDAAEELHETWIAAGRALNGLFQDADTQLTSLLEAEDVNDVVSNLPLADVQAAYRDACAAVAAVNDSNAVVVCAPAEDG